jgi:hypothetical protein
MASLQSIVGSVVRKPDIAERPMRRVQRLAVQVQGADGADGELDACGGTHKVLRWPAPKAMDR